MQSAPNSVQSLHFGLVPSHLDLRERHISHCYIMLDGGEAFGKTTYSNRSSPPWVVNPSISASSLQWIYSIVTVLPVLIQSVCHGFPVSRGLRKIPRFLSRPKNAFTREALNAACIRRFERVWRIQIPISIGTIDVIAVCSELESRRVGDVDVELVSRHGEGSPTACSRRWRRLWGTRHWAWRTNRPLGSSMLGP